MFQYRLTRKNPLLIFGPYMTRLCLYTRKYIALLLLIFIWHQFIIILFKCPYLPSLLFFQPILTITRLELNVLSYNNLTSTMRIQKVMPIKNKLKRYVLTYLITKSAMSLLKDISRIWPRISELHLGNILNDILSDICNELLFLKDFLRYCYMHLPT